jgi:hypothetical protein
MIPVDKLKEYWERYQARLGVKHLLFVYDESDLQEKIRNIKAGDDILIVVVPSFDGIEYDKDDIQDANEMMIFWYRKYDARSVTPESELDIMEATQKGIKAVRYIIHRTATDCDFDKEMHLYFEKADFGKSHVDPEKNKTGSCNGWSLSITIVDPEFTYSDSEFNEKYPEE